MGASTKHREQKRKLREEIEELRLDLECSGSGIPQKKHERETTKLKTKIEDLSRENKNLWGMNKDLQRKIDGLQRKVDSWKRLDKLAMSRDMKKKVTEKEKL